MTYAKHSREFSFVLFRNHNVCPECAVYDNLSVPLHPALENRRAAMMKRAVRNSTRVVVRKLWHLTTRASRTGVINLKPIGEEGGREGRWLRRGRTIPPASPRGRRWQITWTRAASESRTQLVRAARHAWQLVYHCGMYVPSAAPMTNPRTELPSAVSCANKTSCTDVRFHGRDPADGRRIDLIGEIGSLFCPCVFEIKSLACSIKRPLFNANLKQTRSVTLLRCNR